MNMFSLTGLGWRAMIWMFLLASAFVEPVLAQNSVVPPGNAPGTPPGSYLLSDVESVSLYSGRVNALVPLARVGGRGNAGYAVFQQVKDARWSTQAVPGGYTTIHAVHDTETLNLGRTVFLQPFEYGTVSIRYTATDLSAFPDPYPDGPFTQYRYAAVVMVFTSSDGTEHALYDEKRGGWNTQLQGTYPNEYWFPDPDRGLVFSAKDGSGWTFVADPLFGSPDYYAVTDASFYPSFSPGFREDTVSGYLKNNDGTVVRFENSRAQWIRDRNGNKTTFIYEPNGQNQIRLDKVVDANNRETDFVYGSGYRQVVTTGTGGQSRTVTIYHNSLQNRLRPNSGEVIKSIAGLFPAYPQYGSPYSFDNGNTVFNPTVLSTITLPDGRSYQFYYNAYGEMTRMEAPSGAAVEYEYGAGLPFSTGNQQSPPAFVSGQVGVITRNPITLSSSTQVAIYRRVRERREYADGGTTPTLKTLYGLYENVAGQTFNGKVREEHLDPATETALTRVDHYFYGSPTSRLLASSSDIGLGDPASMLEGRESRTENLDVATNAVLARTDHLWNSGCMQPRFECGTLPNIPLAWSPFIAETTTSLLETSTSQYKIAKKEFGYDKYNNLTDVYEYDYGNGQAGAFKRRSHTEYVTDPNYVSATGAHLRNFPQQSWVSADAAGINKVSLSVFEYDNYASDMRHAPLVARSSVTGHETNNFGVGYTTRGNLTQTTSYADAVNQSGAVNASIKYDILGNPVEVKDGRGYAAMISYNDNYGAPDGEARTNSTQNLPLGGLGTFAFPTSATNALNFTAYTQFDYFTGQAVNVEDINGVISKTLYNDALDRPTQTVAAVGTAQEIQTTIDYDDAPQIKITTTSDLFNFNDNLNKTEILYDKSGRAKESREYEANGNYKVVETKYDSLGRKAKVSNPYRPGEINSNNPIRWTTNKFDSLGRVIEIEMPDGTKVFKAYDANRTLVTDQAGKQRISKTNALGNLTDVWEVIAADAATVAISFPNHPEVTFGYQTSYGYDLLNNLTTVNQGVQTRTFTYNGLSRLLSAVNPEAGTENYQYDGNGNLKVKTDSRAIKTIYDYDELNRIVKRCYTIPNASGNPTSCDELTAQTSNQNTLPVSLTYDNLTNAKGKLTKITTGNPSSPFSVTEYTELDAFGRIKKSRQTTDGIIFNEMNYIYNLSGALVEQTYPSGRVVKNTLDNGGDLTLVQSKKNSNFGFWNYADSFTYTAAGAVSSMQLGNGRWESTQFNARLQPIRIALGTVQNAADQLNLEYSYGTWEAGTLNAQKNNGNLAQQIITVPTTGQAQGFTATQKYHYDALNRLQQATETIPNQSGWQQTFSYDRYGNRRFDTANTTTLKPGCVEAVCNPEINAANNRLVGYQFDNAGNLEQDAKNTTFIYNAENKQTEIRNAENQIIGQYYYDGEGNRVKKFVPATGETTIFVYDAAGRLVAEYSTIVAPMEEAAVNYLTNDHLGSPRINTDAGGLVTSRHDYRPFGDEIARTTYGADEVRQQFTGYERDEESELDYAVARYYNSNHGRFTTVDPVLASARTSNPQTFNRYSYVLNSPYKHTDPLGTTTSICSPQGDTYCNTRYDPAPFAAAGTTPTEGGQPISESSTQDGASSLAHEMMHAMDMTPAVDAVFIAHATFMTEHGAGGRAIPQGVGLPTDQTVSNSYIQRRWNVSVGVQLVDENGNQVSDYEYEVTYDNDSSAPLPADQDCNGCRVEGRRSPNDAGEAFLGTFTAKKVNVDPDPKEYWKSPMDIPKNTDYTGRGTVTIYAPDGRTAKIKFEVTVKGDNAPVIKPESQRIEWTRPGK